MRRGAILALATQVLSAKAFTDLRASKQTKTTTHCALPAGCTPGGGSVREQMATVEGSSWLEESKLRPPGDQGYRKESAKILQQGKVWGGRRQAHEFFSLL